MIQFSDRTPTIYMEHVDVSKLEDLGSRLIVVSILSSVLHQHTTRATFS